MNTQGMHNAQEHNPSIQLGQALLHMRLFRAPAYLLPPAFPFKKQKAYTAHEQKENNTPPHIVLARASFLYFIISTCNVIFGIVSIF